MANPQKENGFTPISNELLERIYSAPFYGSQLKIILLIFRYTYGFSRKSHSLSLSFIHGALGGNKRTIQRELQNLIDKNVISVISVASFNSSRELAINKDYESWSIPFTQQAMSATTDGLQTTTTDGLQTTQERNIKENIKTNTIGDFQSPSVSGDLKKPKGEKVPKKDLDNFFESIWAIYPRKHGKGAISESKKKQLYKIGYDEIKRCVDRYKQYVADNNIESQFIKQGSTFFNSGYVDFLSTNYLRDTEKKALAPISDDPDDWRGG